MGSFSAFENKTAREPDRDRSVPLRPADLSIPKNRSTGNLLAHPSAGADRARIRFSFDDGLAAAEFDTMSRLVSGAWCLLQEKHVVRSWRESAPVYANDIGNIGD